MISLIILGIVFILIAVRQIGNVRFQIWQIMLLGAFGVLVTGQIHPVEAVKSINIDIMLFLFGVFVVGQSLEESGYLAHLSYHFFRKAKTLNSLVLYIMFGMGMFSAFLMNDTLAIIGTPVVLLLAKKTNMQPKILLLSLAFAVTTGSVMSPIGNPQNLLIAIHGGITNPFITFFQFLFIPTALNLFIAYLLLRLFYRKHFHTSPISHHLEPIKDIKMARLVRASLVLLAVMVLAKIVIAFIGLGVDFKLTYISIISAMPVILFCRKRLGIIRHIDWHTLIFFAAMFILMESVWDSGFFQQTIVTMNLNPASKSMIMTVSVLLSQLISNVPLVALYLPMLTEIGGSNVELMALAAGSTIAGNLTILGAASNVIIIQSAERNKGVTLTFWDFVKVGIPLTATNVTVYWLFLSLFG